ncbi:MAG: discoidin domain-containing protein, partial [Melioribacteraceae bacterium]
FERRIAMFPAFFDKDDQLFSNTRFGDFPHYLPTKKIINKDELFTGWMLLSYKKPVTVSSVRDTFSCTKITDENPRTFWVANTNKSGEWLIIDLQKECNVKAIQINLTDYKSNIFFNDSTVFTQYKFYASKDGNNWDCIVDLSNEKQDKPNGYFEIEKPIDARYIKFENVYVPTPNLAINAIRVFGNSNDVKPETPKSLFAERHCDERNATITWDKVDGVVGYNILWGIAKDKLYQTYQIFHDQGAKLELRALNKGVEYFFAIEAFNENGVSEMSEVIPCE